MHIEPIGGKQAEITPVVQQFASRFPKNPDMHSIAEVVKAVKRIRPVQVPMEQLSQIYAKRTATDILQSRMVPVPLKSDRTQVAVLQHRPGSSVRGCIDYGVALTATLNALGVPAKFARRGDRSFVSFNHDGKDYYVNADVYSRNDITPHEVSAKEQASDDFLESRGAFAKGRDAWDIGIHDITQFDKYVKKAWDLGD